MTHTLLHEEVLATRATLEIAVQRLALASAHGIRQKETIREWLERGELRYQLERIPGPNYPHRLAETRGKAGLAGPSWTNMVKRLRMSGFVIKRSVYYQTYELYWRV